VNLPSTTRADDFTFDPADQATLTEIRKKLAELERRDWWLWGTAVSVLLLTSAALFLFSLPSILREQDFFHNSQVEIAEYGLFGIALLFCVFAIHQQFMIKQLRSRMADQIGMMAALEIRAEVFQKMAILDPLTGMFNRRFASEHLPVEIARAERMDLPFTLLMLDLNGLKQINDVHGHAGGDMALREFARGLKKCIRSSDLPVRMGGDEFMVLLPECSAYSVPIALARLRGLSIQFNGVEIPLTFAAGWAEHRRGEAAEELQVRADQALYDDKRTGRAAQHVQKAEADERQVEKMQMVGQMTGRVVHDFNNLLTVIKGYSELLIAEAEGAHPMRRRLEDIRKAASNAAQMTQQLLAFTRKQALESKVVNINAKIADMEGLIRPLLGEKIKLVTGFAPQLDDVRAQVGQIEQIVMNLVVNARDSMTQGGTLTIETFEKEFDDEFVRTHPGARPGRFVCVAVTDTSNGMDDTTKMHIFEPFFAKPGGAGTGLGLSNVYGAVKQLGGYLDVQSEPGKGSRFSVCLPRYSEEEVVPAFDLGPAEPAGALRKHQPTVLVVESVEALRKLTCNFLKHEGYNFLEAENATLALQLVAEHPEPIDLVLTDIVLPGMSSREMAQALISRRPEISILYIAGYAETDVAYDDVIRSGSFLESPFTPADLARKVREMIPSRAAQASTGRG
jgi:diguanylate cyclase (GGDEF)-like protein